ncbi:MAG: fasciclin domain-containing protein [Nostocales cyanobacterium ELA583]|jgi:uncharacterized surface protein with fasciclin (FAS1) repeats
MKSNDGNLLVKIIGIMGLAGASLLTSIPSPAKDVRNPNPSIFNEPRYNRGKRPSNTAPVTKPTPSETTVPTVKPTPIAPTTETKNLVELVNELADNNRSFKTLLEALDAAGLTKTLQGPGLFTIFAPTDAAFKKLPQDALRELLKPENKEVLVKILTYHVVPGKVLSSDLKSGEVKSLQGDPITVKVDKATGVVMINDAKVTQADIKGKNGVIHQIDNLILPPSL